MAFWLAKIWDWLATSKPGTAVTLVPATVAPGTAAIGCSAVPARTAPSSPTMANPNSVPRTSTVSG